MRPDQHGLLANLAPVEAARMLLYRIDLVREPTICTFVLQFENPIGCIFYELIYGNFAVLRGKVGLVLS